MSACRSCGAPLRWAVTAKGRRLPLDPEPAATGNVVVDATGAARVLSPLEPRPADVPLYLSHFATCPDANIHRRRGAA